MVHCQLLSIQYSLRHRSFVKAGGLLGQFSGLAINIHTCTWGLTKFLFQLQMLGYDISWAAFNIIEVMSSSKFTFKVSLQCSVFSQLSTVQSSKSNDPHYFRIYYSECRYFWHLLTPVKFYHYFQRVTTFAASLLVFGNFTVYIEIYF